MRNDSKNMQKNKFWLMVVLNQGLKGCRLVKCTFFCIVITRKTLWRAFAHSELNTSVSPLRILAKKPKSEEASIDSNPTIKYS